MALMDDRTLPGVLPFYSPPGAGCQGLRTELRRLRGDRHFLATRRAMTEGAARRDAALLEEIDKRIAEVEAEIDARMSR